MDQLHGEQFHVAGLHSEKSQDLRFKIISAMKNGMYTSLCGNEVHIFYCQNAMQEAV